MENKIKMESLHYYVSICDGCGKRLDSFCESEEEHEDWDENICEKCGERLFWELQEEEQSNTKEVEKNGQNQ